MGRKKATVAVRPRLEWSADPVQSAGDLARSARTCVIDAASDAGTQILFDCASLSTISSALLAVILVAPELGLDASDLALVLSDSALASLDAWRIDTGWSVFTNVDAARRFLDAGGTE